MGSLNVRTAVGGRSVCDTIFVFLPQEVWQFWCWSTVTQFWYWSTVTQFWHWSTVTQFWYWSTVTQFWYCCTVTQFRDSLVTQFAFTSNWPHFSSISSRNVVFASRLRCHCAHTPPYLLPPLNTLPTVWRSTVACARIYRLR
jgi:hypothetical protein